MKKRHWLERVFWTFAVIISIALCSYLVYDTWLKWQNTPVIVTFSEKSTPVYEIPFPTVTICTDVKIRKTNFNYGQVWHELNEEAKYRKFPNVSDAKKLYILAPLCRSLPKYLDEYLEMHDLSATLADADEKFYQVAKRYAPTLSDVLSDCSWRRYSRPCGELFNEVLTDDGICYSFNLLNASELYHEEYLNEHYHVTRHDRPSYYWNGNIPANLTEDMIYPRRVLIGSEGLRFQLNLPTKDKDYVCSGPVQSFKIQLHSANDHPQMHQYFYRIPMQHDIVMAVHPNIINSTDQLIQNYDKEKRQCIDEEKDKRILLFFKKYTQRNCKLEALAYRTHKKCECCPYGLPRQKNQTICRTVEELQCAQHIESNSVQNIWNGSQIDFDCKPSCRSISYDAEISMSEYDQRNFDMEMGNYSKSQWRRRVSRVLITFKDEQFFASRRAEMYSKTDFIASCGGILGLFMGFSILSIVEIVYFSTLRIGCSLRKRRQIKKRRLKQLKVIDELNGGGDIHEGNSHHSDYDNLPKMKY